MDVFFTQEMLDFYRRTTPLNNDIVGEVSIHRPHLAMTAQWKALDPVLYVTTDSVNCSLFLSISPLLVDPEPLVFLSKETEFYADMTEVLPRQAPLGPFTITAGPFTEMLTVFWSDGWQWSSHS